MNRPKLTKKELAARADKLEEQVDRLKNRLNRYSYKKTKQGNRLELLRENVLGMGRRLEHVDRHVTDLAADEQALPAQSKKLQKQVRGLKQALEELQARDNTEAELSNALQELQQKQQRLKADLRVMRKVIKRVSDGTDDLHRDNKELGKHVRNLEESSSKLSIHQQAHDGRIRDLEAAFAESNRQQEKRLRKERDQSESERKEIGKGINSLEAELALLREQTANGHGQQKDLKRRIERLSNRIGELGGQLTLLHDDLEHRLESGDQRMENLEQQLPELTSQLGTLQKARAQDSGIIDALELNQEKTLQLGQEAVQNQQALSEHLERLEQHLEQMQAEAQQSEARLRELEASLQELAAEAEGERTQVDKLEQGLAHAREEASGLKGDLERETATRSTEKEHLEQLLGTQEASTRTHAQQLASLEATVEATSARAAEQEQRTGEWMARLDANQTAAARRLDALDATTGGHEAGLSRLHAGLEQANDTSAGQQQRIEAAHTSSLWHNMALTALLIIGLLGGIALYQLLTERISGIKREVTLSLTRQEDRYATRQQADARYQQLKSSLAETRQRLNQLAGGAVTPVGLADHPPEAPATAEIASRQTRLEQRLDQQEIRIGDLSALLTDRAMASPAPATALPLQQTVTDMEQEIQALQARMERLQSNDRSADDTAQRIIALEQSLSGAQQALAQRLSQVEADRTQEMTQQRHLSERVEGLTRTMATLKQEVQVATLPGEEIRWRQAGEIGQYSIQLLGMHRLKALLAFAEHHPLEEARAYARTDYQGRDWYILLYGMFNTIQDARAAIDTLPDSVKAYQPWIRELPPGLDFTPIP